MLSPAARIIKISLVTKAEKLYKNILDSSKLVKNTDYNAKITDIGNKISNISSLVKKKQIMT